MLPKGIHTIWKCTYRNIKPSITKRSYANPVRPAIDLKDQYSKSNQRRSPAYAWLVSMGFVVGGLAAFKAISELNDYLDYINAPEEKEKLLVLGSGWGAMSLIYGLNLWRYDVTVVSPRNYFLFTPLLSDAAVGSVSTECITEPVRNFRHGPGFQFVEAKALSVDPQSNTVKCETTTSKEKVDLKYDKLIIAVGSVLNDLGVSGVSDHAIPLKEINDAARIRNTIVDCLERASASWTTEEERRKLLHFVVVGGSAQAAEAAAEIHDYVESSINSSYPELKEFFRVTLVDSKDHVHNYYDKSISQAIQRVSKKDRVEFISKAQVTKISKNSLSYVTSQSVDSESEDPKSSSSSKRQSDTNNSQTIPFGVCVWSPSSSINPLIQDLRTKLSNDQTNERAIVTDLSLKVQGADNIFALGDCATVNQGALLKRCSAVFEKADINRDGTIDLNEFNSLMKELSRTFPALKAIDDRIFHMVDENHDRVLTQDEFKNLLTYVDRTLTRFPATATVAAQQGEFLAMHLNKGHFDVEKHATEEGSKVESVENASDVPKEEAQKDADHTLPELSFRYKHIGGYEYVGAEDGFVERGSQGKAIVTGPGAMWLWRAAYFSRILSNSMRVDVLMNWIHTSLFGYQPTRV